MVTINAIANAHSNRQSDADPGTESDRHALRLCDECTLADSGRYRMYLFVPAVGSR
jgi:hypothetical protein